MLEMEGCQRVGLAEATINFRHKVARQNVAITSLLGNK